MDISSLPKRTHREEDISLQRTKVMPPMCPLFGDSTILINIGAEPGEAGGLSSLT